VNIYLIGFMGSGKSTAGRKIASSLHWTFIDTDKLVEEQNSSTVAEIFAARGEKYFREAEAKALQTVSARSRTVVACGGGTPCSAENISIMKNTGVVVYLRLPVETLVSRLEKSRTIRPLLQGARDTDMTTRVQDLLEQRVEWYEQADIIADSLNMTVEELTARLADLIRSRGAFL
jgi:shikimate kinase